ncbi:MAG: alanyl-tRNA editing protein [Desulfurococcales archaeon]|nr:alanyl-tRNA editing protein [Desulfurococcales archaeon]
MTTKLLYMDDSYLKEFDAEVIDSGENWVVLDQTAFYPRGGGLPCDTGVIKWDSGEARVTRVLKEEGTVRHYLQEGTIPVGTRVHGVIDWDRRYRIMRTHTGLHVLIAVLNKMAGVLVTGNQIGLEESRVDVNLEKPDRSIVEEAISEANNVLRKGIEVKIYYMPREEAMKIPGIVKLANALPPSVDTLRIVEIPGVDIQADGGPHVRNTSEVGEIVFLRLKNKGRNNRRIYFAINP